jgi:hypothetical protein
MDIHDRVNLVLRRKALEDNASSASGGVAGIPGFGFAVRQFIWENTSRLRVYFYESDFRTQVLDLVQEWSEHAKMDFVEAPSAAAADVRVSFRREPNRFWSLLGTQSRDNRDLGKHTMSLGFTRNTPAKEIKRLVLHEFGHALGLQHEMQNPRAGIVWDTEKAIAYYSRLLPGLSRDEVWAQLRLYENDSRRYLIRDFDPASIMMYPIEKELLRSGWVKAMGNWNYELAESDIDIVREMYPGRDAVGRKEEDKKKTGDRDEQDEPDEPVTDGERGELEVDGPALKDTIMNATEKDIFRFRIPAAGVYVIEAKGTAFVTLAVSGPGIDEPRLRNTPTKGAPAVYDGFFRKGSFKVEVTASGSDPDTKGSYSIRLRQTA